MKNVLSRLEVALALSGIALLSACGGGGAGGGALQSSISPGIPSVPSTPAPQQATGGPVGYLQTVNALSSSGTIAQGAHQAIVAVMSGSTGSNTNFTPDSLTITTPVASSSSLRSAQTLARRTLASQVVPVEAFPADDSALLSKMQRIYTGTPAGASRAADARTFSTIPASPSVGATASIWVQQGVSSSQSVQVPATLVAQTAHGNIWLDNTLLKTAAASNAAQIGTDFENAYASDTQHFASPDYPSSAPGLQAQYQSCAADGTVQGSGPGYIAEPADRRINVMIVNPSQLGGYGGYFTGSNLMNQSALNCLNGSGSKYESNEAPFIFVGWFSTQSSTYELKEDMVRGTAHELQHLINFVNHAILAGGASTAGFNGVESTFINEGLSMLAQDFAVQRMYSAQGVQFDVDDALSRADAYLANPGNFSISAFSGIDSYVYGGGGAAQYNCFGGCYGGAYLFQRYLADRFGGDRYTHAVETSGVIGTQNLASVTGESAGGLLDDFALAMAADTLGVSSSNSRFNFGTLGLTQAYGDQFGATKTLGGLYAVPMSGSSASVKAPIGGFAFVSVASVPASGLPVTVTDQASASGFGLAGGLAQH